MMTSEEFDRRSSAIDREFRLLKLRDPILHAVLESPAAYEFQDETLLKLAIIELVKRNDRMLVELRAALDKVPVRIEVEGQVMRCGKEEANNG